MLTRQQLESLKFDKVTDLLWTLYTTNHHAKTQIDLMVTKSQEGDSDKLISLIKKGISSLERSCKRLNYYESDHLADTVEELRSSIIDVVMMKNPLLALDLLLQLLNTSTQSIELADDLDDSINEIYIEVADDLPLIVPIALKSMDKIVDFIFSRWIENDYSVYDNIIINFKDILQEEGLLLLKQKFEQHEGDRAYLSYKNQGLAIIAQLQNDFSQK